jgi:2,6-dihydroxypyridine 3-monooxygenase
MKKWSNVDVSPIAIDFANGTTVESDLIVFADGVNSIARANLVPGSQPRYSGYVAWRGMVPESEVSASSKAILGNCITYHVYANSHILVYPIPGLDGEVEPGKRLINFVWYRNYSSGGDMEDLLTDINGVQRDVSLPPGAVSAHHVAEMKTHAEARLPTAIAEIVTKTEEPFLQVVFDLAIPRMNFGHTCLLGDSANLARPHAAAGTAKAADDAWALGDALSSTSSVSEALEKYNQSQTAIGHQLIHRTESIGRRSQFDGTWVPGDRDLIFGLKAPGA